MTYRRSYTVNGVDVKEEITLCTDDEVVSFLYLFFMNDKKAKRKKKEEEVRVQVDWKDVEFSRWFKEKGGKDE